MLVKKYLGETLQNALQQAKQELGDDIILLESKDIHQHAIIPGQKRLVQVTVGVNEHQPKISSWTPEQIVHEKAKPKPETPKIQPEQMKIRTEQHNRNNFSELLAQILPQKPQEQEQENRILNEILLLRQEINQLSRRSTKLMANDFSRPYAMVFDELEEKGVAADLAQELVKRVYLKLEGQQSAHIVVESHKYEQVVLQVKEEVKIIVKPFDFRKLHTTKRQHVVMLLGSTGVGKSTTAMKLASNPEIFGKKDTAIISSDPYGPSEPLKAFSKITGINVFEAKSFEDISSALQHLKDKEVIIVDTPGKSPFAPNHINKLEKYVEVIKPSDIFLVLSMATDTRDLFLSCGINLMLKPTGFIFTKFDETSQPGKALSILEEIKLPVVCFCEGKRIFIDIVTGNVDFIFNKLFDSK